MCGVDDRRELCRSLRIRVEVVEQDGDGGRSERIGGRREASAGDLLVRRGDDPEIGMGLGEDHLPIALRCAVRGEALGEDLADRPPDDRRRLDPEDRAARAIGEPEAQALRAVRILEIEDVDADPQILEQCREAAVCVLQKRQRPYRCRWPSIGVN